MGKFEPDYSSDESSGSSSYEDFEDPLIRTNGGASAAAAVAGLQGEDD